MLRTSLSLHNYDSALTSERGAEERAGSLSAR
jgi:hypothetical protein